MQRSVLITLMTAVVMNEGCFSDDSGCTKSTDCRADLCTVATCVGGQCQKSPAPDGPSAEQKTGDCRMSQCRGGREVEEFSPSDVPPARRDCTIPSCEQGLSGIGVVLRPAPRGTSCDPNSSPRCVAGACTD